MLNFVNQYKWDRFSQNGEDGIIAECLRRIDPALKVAVEFGGADGYYCSNTAALRERGWNVMMYDLEAVPGLVMKCRITPENVNQVVRPCSVLSIDIDGKDYEVWEAYNWQPDIVVIEINSSLHPMSGMKNDSEMGSAYLPMVELGLSKGYFLLCHTGNLIFTLNKHRDLFPEIIGDGIDNWRDYFNTSWL